MLLPLLFANLYLRELEMTFLRARRCKKRKTREPREIHLPRAPLNNIKPVEYLRAALKARV